MWKHRVWAALGLCIHPRWQGQMFDCNLRLSFDLQCCWWEQIKMSCRGCIGIWMQSVSWRTKCWQDRRTESEMWLVSNLTYWVKAESVVFTVVAEEKAALHRDVLFDVLSWRLGRSTVLLLKTATFECNIFTQRVPVWSKTETVWEGMARLF